MKQILLILLGLLLLIFFYRLVFSYRLVALSNSGSKKHKMYNVYYFPNAPLSIINPLKKEKLKKLIMDYSASDRYALELKERHKDLPENLKIFFNDYGKKVLEGNFEVISIKSHDKKLHVLTENHFGETLVFELEHNQIVGFY